MGVRPGTPKPPGSGRKRGSIDRAQRLLLTEKMAGDILKVYKALGGVKWLIGWAKANETEFIRQGLARLMPAFPKDPNEDAGPLVALNFSGDPAEAARRIAFALAKGNAELDNANNALLAERVPYVEMAREEDPFKYPTPAPDPQRDQWAKEASMSPEEKLNSESLDEHVNRRAFADRPPRPSWMPAEDRPARVPVRALRNKRDLL